MSEQCEDTNGGESEQRNRLMMAIAITVLGLVGTVILFAVSLLIVAVPVGEVTPLSLEFATGMGLVGVVATAVLALSALFLPNKRVTSSNE